MVTLRLPIPCLPQAAPPKQRRAPARWQRIGSGRSAVVYRERTVDGDIVHKRFGGEGAAQLVMQILTGAPNPYEWNRDAVRCALLRRKILRILLRFWFEGKISTPRPVSIRTIKNQTAFSLQMEHIRGSHLPLWHGLGKPREDLLRKLLADVMRPLQSHLQAAGFIGLVWQAGLGNPVAAGNFMLRSGRRQQWSWVDLESGVPALFPLNPIALFNFYLPECIRRRRVLFDDVDLPALRGYLAGSAKELNGRLGAATVKRLHQLVARLEIHQQRWKSLSRVQLGIRYYIARRRINAEQAQWYAKHPVAWHLRLAADAATAIAKEVRHSLGQVFQLTTLIFVLQMLIGGGKYFFSERHREHWARRYVHSRLRQWRNRRFLSRGERKKLWRAARQEESLQCVNDLIVHTACKLPAKVVQLVLLPLLLALGLITAPTAGLILLTGGPLLRTIYTVWRCGQAIASRKHIPWVALMTGVLPIVGTAAFAWQLLYWKTRSPRRNPLPLFLIHETFAAIGRSVPIWGGQDSLVEAWFNRLPRLFTR